MYATIEPPAKMDNLTLSAWIEIVRAKAKRYSLIVGNLVLFHKPFQVYGFFIGF